MSWVPIFPATRVRPRRLRRGVGGVLLIVVVACALVTTLAAIWALGIIRARADWNRQHARLQADWLADAAVQRALRGLARDRQYHGETWTVPGESLLRVGDIQVTIQVIREDGQPPAAERIEWEIHELEEGAPLRARGRWPPAAPEPGETR